MLLMMLVVGIAMMTGILLGMAIMCVMMNGGDDR